MAIIAALVSAVSLSGVVACWLERRAAVRDFCQTLSRWAAAGRNHAMTMRRRATGRDTIHFEIALATMRIESPDLLDAYLSENVATQLEGYAGVKVATPTRVLPVVKVAMRPESDYRRTTLSLEAPVFDEDDEPTWKHHKAPASKT